MKRKSEPGHSRVCAWRTGTTHCRMRPSGAYCSWHSYWLRLVEHGNLMRQQQEEFFEWWEQFQPYGIYADQPGPWWADKELLWAAIIGKQDPPAKTSEVERELILRRHEVRRYSQGLTIAIEPSERVAGLPLPSWQEDEWKKKINGSFQDIKQCG